MFSKWQLLLLFLPAPLGFIYTLQELMVHRLEHSLSPWDSALSVPKVSWALVCFPWPIQRTLNVFAFHFFKLESSVDS